MKAALAAPRFYKDTAPMTEHDPIRAVKLRLQFDHDIVFGPGKAELLDRIQELGSIAKAGRAMGMSYKRAWSLVEELNASFRTPVVQSSRGGKDGGGATVSAEGLAALAAYRRLQVILQETGAQELDTIRRLLRDETS